ncbi:hypothetical protein RirG_075080 [Rhizophagus irregularis DAOM 197198w]|uniref:SWIM-type domain-containing protein n=1 Tax=Rhizophagus irregularis (strain DAOM 197198w) TaxID=1432141 RepID=A0A015KW64_RHIIW|nr:hypothetical protein RirG_075080 [Rhizophagus irregularis DAOM 197198w]
MHRDEMNQSLYYVAMLVERNCEVMEEELLTKNSDEASEIDLPQATLKQIISYVGLNNVKEIWAVSVGNSSKIKHYILLLQNWGYICSCLSIVQSGIICRHYFQVMLTTKEAVFHIRFIPTRWYNEDRNAVQESFITADKLTVFEQKIVYGKLHGVYKKALNKALQTTSKSEQLISLLQEFADDKNDNDETDSEEFYQYDDTSDKENFDPSIPLLQNPKKRREKGRPLGGYEKV